MKTITIKKARIEIVVIGLVLLLAVILAVKLPVQASSPFPQIYDLVTVNNVDGNGINQPGSIAGVSDDGNFVLFRTSATDLPNATSPGPHSSGIYRRDMSLGMTQRVDSSESGVGADGTTLASAMSATGRYVIFTANATNLIDGVTLTGITRLYLKDLQENKNFVISDTAGYFSPVSVSNDGRFIMGYTNRINDLIPGSRSGTNYTDIVLYDRTKNEWMVLSRGYGGSLPATNSWAPSSSCDGSLVVFASEATNLAPGHAGSGSHVYLADVRNGLLLTDITPSAIENYAGNNPEISCDGRYIAYGTKDRTIVSPTPTGMSSHAQAVRYDRLTGERIYIHPNGSERNTYQINISLSDAGDVVMSSSPYPNAYPVPSDTKVYFKHLSDGSNTLKPVQHNAGGLAYHANFTPDFRLSADGRYVVVYSRDSTVLGLPGSLDSNGSAIPHLIRIKTGL